MPGEHTTSKWGAMATFVWTATCHGKSGQPTDPRPGKSNALAYPLSSCNRPRPPYRGPPEPATSEFSYQGMMLLFLHFVPDRTHMTRRPSRRVSLYAFCQPVSKLYV
jgi:hypothetical protein